MGQERRRETADKKRGMKSGKGEGRMMEEEKGRRRENTGEGRRKKEV